MRWTTVWCAAALTAAWSSRRATQVHHAHSLALGFHNSSNNDNGSQHSVSPKTSNNNNNATPPSSPNGQRIRRKRLIVVLDLDHTLINTLSEREDGELIAALPRPDAHLVYSTHNEPTKHRPMWFRPHLETFLRQLSEFAEIHVYSAATYGYALGAVRSIDPRGEFFARDPKTGEFSIFARDKCKMPGYGKDLLVIPGAELRSCVLVDDMARSFVPQPLNGILVPRFEVRQSADLGYVQEDRVLLDLLPLLRRLADALEGEEEERARAISEAQQHEQAHLHHHHHQHHNASADTGGQSLHHNHPHHHHHSHHHHPQAEAHLHARSTVPVGVYHPVDVRLIMQEDPDFEPYRPPSAVKAPANMPSTDALIENVPTASVGA